MSAASHAAPVQVIERALDRARRAGADAADAVMVESETREARVRGDEIDFVKQARERVLGVRALIAGGVGFRSAVTSTSDLSAEAVERLAEQTVVLARATAADPAAGLPEGGFADDAPELELWAPEDRDVHDPDAWRGKLLFHPDEHRALQHLISWGLTDIFRKHHPEDGLYSWWDYRGGAFHRGWGLRIDYLLVSAPIVGRTRAVTIDREARKSEKPSDHAPVVLDLED